MKKLFWLLIIQSLLLSVSLANDIPKVPSTMQFAGMKLKLSKSAQQEIQQDVDALHASRKYFDIKLDRVNLYFPIIEKIFKEENLPDEFKYLAIQESSLISDAVSSANAVGYWQFKEPAGNEVGLRIDKTVDERLNIVSATRGAAKYLKRHQLYFRNWIYSLMAYNTGRGGAARYVDKALFGVNTMPIDKDTHWYVKKFLAHKVAFENEVGGAHSEGMRLDVYENGGGKSLSKIAKELDVEYSLLAQYNKWLYKGDVPSERVYPVIVPMVKGHKFNSNTPIIASRKEVEDDAKDAPDPTPIYADPGEALDGKVNKALVRLNGLPAIMVQEGDDFKQIAEKSEKSVKKLARYNEVSPKHKVTPGEFYYLKKKRRKAKIFYYTAKADESLWDISQKFGMRVKSLARFNRMSVIDKLETGRVLWMRKKRPKDEPVEYNSIPAQEAEEMVAIKEAEPQETNEQKALTEVVEKVPDPAEKEHKETEKPEQTVQVVEKEEVAPIEKENIEEKDKAGKHTHIVQAGETMYRLSRLYDVSIKQIQEWNGLPDFTISPGQELVISAEAQPVIIEKGEEQVAPENVTFHEVEPGDTMYSISRKYSISVEKLMEINNKDNYNLSVGEKLKVVQ